MSSSINITLLSKCTQHTIDKYPWVTDYNSTLISNLNKTELLDLIAEMLQTPTPENFTGNIRNYITSCLFSHPRFELPFYQQLIWICLFSAMLVVAISGNAIVIWIVLAHRRMRTVTNYFLLNLSLADLLMSTLNCVFNFIFMLNSDWPFGAAYCTINNFIANVSVGCSVFTLCAITLDRYIAIVRPLQHRTSRKKARIFLLIIWVSSCLLAAPCIMYSTTMTKTYMNGKSRTVCYMLWPDGRYPTSMADYIYNIVFLTVTYAIPMMIMLVCYTSMGRELWGSRSIGEHTERQMESMKSKKKVVRMFIIVCTIFAICWLPYQLFFIYAYHNPKFTSSSYAQHMYLGFYWLAMAQSMVNPIIYYWMNGRFRVYFQQAICCCCIRFLNIPSVAAKTGTRKLGTGGILSKKQSHSELGRTKSGKRKKLIFKLIFSRLHTSSSMRHHHHHQHQQQYHLHHSSRNESMSPLKKVPNENNSLLSVPSSYTQTTASPVPNNTKNTSTEEIMDFPPTPTDASPLSCTSPALTTTTTNVPVTTTNLFKFS
ncbi:tachykinin-like peptides receptor 86C [Culicoides brevitarsis]|uniref:tachykinin-like peptides receptor 86C n=1 Tax=Culicoides brevitarsis TaxID=469753 RepID=UPI00307B555F